MDFGKTLIDIRKQDADVVNDFTALHPDFKIFMEKREDKLSLSAIQIVKYIVACYDKESPLVNAYKKRWSVKKKECAVLAGLPQDKNGRFDEDADNLIFCQNEVINRVILRYLYLIHDRDWQTYVIYNEMNIHQSVELIKYNFQQPAHAKSAKENLDTLNKDIEALEYKIFSGEETKKLKDMLYEEASNMLNDLRPEKIVERLEKGLSPVDYSPYGNYKKAEMSFLGDE
jgi:hypothetical protein